MNGGDVANAERTIQCELECRALIKGVETRLDADYEPPPPEQPAWVERLRDREGF